MYTPKKKCIYFFQGDVQEGEFLEGVLQGKGKSKDIYYNNWLTSLYISRENDLIDINLCSELSSLFIYLSDNYRQTSVHYSNRGGFQSLPNLFNKEKFVK